MSRSTSGGTFKRVRLKKIQAVFYLSEAGNEPVRDWIKTMSAADRQRIGKDISTVEFGWPVGMPACRPLGDGLHEVRTSLSGNRIARIFFCVDKNQEMVLLHGILKKTQATPFGAIALARTNKLRHERAIEGILNKNPRPI